MSIHRSTLCTKGQHDWCYNRNLDECHCKCACHIKRPRRLFKDDWLEQLTPDGIRISAALDKALEPIIRRALRGHLSLRDLELLVHQATIRLRLALLKRGLQKGKRNLRG